MEKEKGGGAKEATDLPGNAASSANGRDSAAPVAGAPPGQQPQQGLPDQMQPPMGMQQQAQQAPPAQPQVMRQQFNLLYTTPSLGLSLGLETNSQKVKISKVLPGAPHRDTLKAGDILVGINGRPLPRYENGRDGFDAAIGLLKATSRPMVVAFERWAVTNDAPAADPGAASQMGPLPMSAAARPQSRADAMEGLTLRQLQRKREYLDESSDEESEGSEGEDDIDWYDAHILSYDTEARQFVVHFLGDTPDVKYTMALRPQVVRPSVRAWTKRTLALLHGQGDMLALRGEGGGNFLGDLPPSTDLPDDVEKLEELRKGAETEGGGGSMLEYKKLLAEQRFLATRLSPQNDDEDEEDNDEDGPGPMADSVYVASLCECMKEAEKACAWLMGESAMSNLLSQLQDGSPPSAGSEVASTTTKVSKEALLSFLVSGARYLNTMLASDPSSRSASATKRGKRKKRRSNAGGTTDGRMFDDGVFDGMLSKALVSNESLSTVIKTLLKKPPAPKTSRDVLVTTMLTNVLATMFDKLWSPVTDWIDRAEDMATGKSAQLYSFAEVEAQLQAAKTMNLALVDLSTWTEKLVTKLSRARIFEMEAWSAIQACVQPVVGSGSDDEDDCSLALQRLKKEATPGAASSAEDQHMRNLNPLGRHSVDSTGLTMPSSLTRAVIDDAIAVRQWVLDLNQAKAVRERLSFVQDIVERYVTLPQLPTPPFGRLDGTVTNPSALLAVNTKDTITILSSGCYSYSHIIGNVDLRLQNDALLRSKQGVASALVELMRLPILSIAEEKLKVREELIEWNEEAQQKMAASANSKLSFPQIEALYKKLLTIIDIKSDRRAKVCQKLKPNQSMDDQVRAFAIADEKIICPATGAWVRDQYKLVSEWMAQYHSIKTNLISHGHLLGATSSLIASTAQSNLVGINEIDELLKRHDARLAVSFPEEYSQLDRVRQTAVQWTQEVHRIVVAGTSLTLDERCMQLANAQNQRPKGILLAPEVDAINLWIRVLTWRLNLQTEVLALADRYAAWKSSNATNQNIVENEGMLQLIHTILAPLIIEGQDLLVETSSSNLLTSLRKKVLVFLQTNMIQTDNKPPFSRKDILGSGAPGQSVLDLVWDMEADKGMGSSLLATMQVFWLLMHQQFVDALSQSKTFAGDLEDAKALLLFCPQRPGDSTTSFLDTMAETGRLQQLITDAERLQQTASDVLLKCASVLQKDCFSHKEQLRASLLGLSAVQSDFNDEKLALAVQLLEKTGLRQKLDGRIRGLSWLVGTFAYADVFSAQAGESAAAHRIHCNNLKDLHGRIPSNVGQQWKVVGDGLDSEVVRVSSIVKAMWNHASQWQRKAAALLLTSSDAGPVVSLDELTKLAEDQILSKVTMPELEMVRQVSAKAQQFQKRIGVLFQGEYSATMDVNNARLPEGRSLLENGGDFILYRFTGSEMYAGLQQALDSLKEDADMLPVMTPEKATYLWMAEIMSWVELLKGAGEFNHEQLVMTIDDALEILEQGHKIFWSCFDQVQSYLRGEKISLQVSPETVEVDAMSKGTYSLGIGLLRWGALLFECLQSDIEREDNWKERVLKAVNRLSAFELGSVGGQVSSFTDATSFRNHVSSLMEEASNLIIQDRPLINSLSALPAKMTNSPIFQRCIGVERNAAEQRKYLEERATFDLPLSLVDDRYNLLDSLLGRLPPPSAELDNLLEKSADGDNSFFAGDPSARDKSRLFLEKSLLTGMETLGINTSEVAAQDFCSLFAWELEDAVYEKFNDSAASNSYRDKVRSLRFNLQDPKNPILCARVLGGNLPIEELITSSAEDLASNQVKMMRRQVEEEARKNVVLSAGSTEQKQPPVGFSSELAAKIQIESKAARSSNAEAVPVAASGTTSSSRDDGKATAALLASPASFSPSSSPSPEKAAMRTKTNELLASLPPPPMSSRSKKHHRGELPSPPPSPLADGERPSAAPVAASHTHHIKSNTGSELFLIKISKLKITFTTKIAVDESCSYDVDRFLPNTLAEKGRLSLDQFNSFVHEKSKSSRWNFFHLKLSSMSGDSMSAYKRFYKEYESVGRIAMIQPNEGTKLFLVTPKFLRAAQYFRSLDHEISRTSTYMLVLTRESLPNTGWSP
ncbi:hypothetical protein ACHAXT_012195 [Thalassiosira profunda]